MTEPDPYQPLDFSNTEIAFSGKSDKELKKTAWLFRFMNKASLVHIGAKLGLIALKFRFPFTESIVRTTIFPQFCGGETLLDCQKVIDKLYAFDTLTVLDYGAEGKTDEDELDTAMNETIRAIEMAASNNSVPVVSTKITGLVNNVVLEKLQNKEILTEGEKRQFQHLKKRLEEICEKASEHSISVFIDAEESWMQDPIDALVLTMMDRYNKGKSVVYNTYQLYNKDKLEHLKRDHQYCIGKGIIFGAKLVRGAYMDKERERAQRMGYNSPIHADKHSTDRDYNEAVRYCIEHIDTISSCCASHNTESNLLQARLIAEKNIEKNHPHVNFCQLYGMSDNLTFNLANAGYNAAKYVVYGPIREVIPYLIRRTEENTSVTGDMSRELALIEKEIKRRGIQ
jgi:proline dehydrogenase